MLRELPIFLPCRKILLNCWARWWECSSYSFWVIWKTFVGISCWGVVDYLQAVFENLRSDSRDLILKSAPRLHWLSQFGRVTIRSYAVIVTHTNWDISVLKIGISDDALWARFSAEPSNMVRIWSCRDVKFLGVGNHLSQLKELSIVLRSNIFSFFKLWFHLARWWGCNSYSLRVLWKIFVEITCWNVPSDLQAVFGKLRSDSRGSMLKYPP